MIKSQRTLLIFDEVIFVAYFILTSIFSLLCLTFWFHFFVISSWLTSTSIRGVLPIFLFLFYLILLFYVIRAHSWRVIIWDLRFLNWLFHLCWLWGFQPLSPSDLTVSLDIFYTAFTSFGIDLDLILLAFINHRMLLLTLHKIIYID